MEDEIMDFCEKYFPTDPRKLLEMGIEVPLPYMVLYYHTYGCNNWRKNHGLPMHRRYGR